MSNSTTKTDPSNNCNRFHACIISLLSNTLGLPLDEVCADLETDTSIDCSMEVEKKYRVSLVNANESFSTNIEELFNRFSEDKKNVLRKHISLLIQSARVYYKQLLKDYPKVFTRYAHHLKRLGRNPLILNEVTVCTCCTSLYFNEDGPWLGLYVSDIKPTTATQ